MLRALSVEVERKAHIDLQLVKVQILQGAEGGVGCPEVVHPDLKAQRVKMADKVNEFLRVVAEGAFRDLDIQKFPGNPVGTCERIDTADQAGLFKILP